MLLGEEGSCAVATAGSGDADVAPEGWLSGSCCCQPGWRGGGRPEAVAQYCRSGDTPWKRPCSQSGGSLLGHWQGWGEPGAGLGGSSPLPGPGMGSVPLPVCIVKLGHKPNLCEVRRIYGAQAQSGAQSPFGVALRRQPCPAPCAWVPWGFLIPTPQQSGVKAASCPPLQLGLGGVRAHPRCSASNWAQLLLPGLLLAVQHEPAGPERASGLGAGLHGQGHRGFHPG